MISVTQVFHPLAGVHAAHHAIKAANLPVNIAAGFAHAMLDTPFLRALFPHMVGAAALTERLTREFKKPEWGIDGVTQETVMHRPFCDLLRFQRDGVDRDAAPKILLVAPMSGHYATLLRDTVDGLTGSHDVYVTDWKCATQVPLSHGKFDLDDYIIYIQKMIRAFQGNVHVMAVCQPGVPVLAAISLMEQGNEPHVPKSMILMGSPINTRVSPTAVNDLATSRGTRWFADHVLTVTPYGYPGAGRPIYPGYSQLYGFMAMNLERHADAYRAYFNAASRGDREAMEKHKAFYDEYNAVMSLDAGFYMQTIDKVFVNHHLPKGEFIHTDENGERHVVNPAAIRRVALLTVEGEKDDITGAGQTMAAHTLTPNIPLSRKVHFVQPGVGHYGIFSRSGWRKGVLPQVAHFVGQQQNAPVLVPRRHLRVV